MSKKQIEIQDEQLDSIVGGNDQERHDYEVNYPKPTKD